MYLLNIVSHYRYIYIVYNTYNRYVYIRIYIRIYTYIYDVYYTYTNTLDGAATSGVGDVETRVDDTCAVGGGVVTSP